MHSILLIAAVVRFLVAHNFVLEVVVRPVDVLNSTIGVVLAVAVLAISVPHFDITPANATFGVRIRTRLSVTQQNIVRMVVGIRLVVAVAAAVVVVITVDDPAVSDAGVLGILGVIEL